MDTDKWDQKRREGLEPRLFMDLDMDKCKKPG